MHAPKQQKHRRWNCARSGVCTTPCKDMFARASRLCARRAKPRVIWKLHGRATRTLCVAVWFGQHHSEGVRAQTSVQEAFPIMQGEPHRFKNLWGSVKVCKIQNSKKVLILSYQQELLRGHGEASGHKGGPSGEAHGPTGKP